MTNRLEETTYSPESLIRHPLRLLQTMFADTGKGYHLASRIFLRDIKAKYRQSALGFLWAFFPPIATTLTFAILNKSGVINVGETSMPYVAYAMIGTLLWQTFTDSIQAPLRIITQSKPMLTKINFPREALLVAGIMQVLFDFCIRLSLFCAVVIYFRIELSWSACFLPLGVLSIILTGTMFGVLFTPIGMLYTDIQQGLTMMLGFWMLMTPVVYPPATSGILQKVASINPVSPLITTSRDLLTAQTPSFTDGFLWVTGISILLLLFGWIVFRVALPHVIARLGN